MTFFYNMMCNNIQDGVRHLWWLSVVNVSTEQGSTEFRTPLCVILATPLKAVRRIGRYFTEPGVPFRVIVTTLIEVSIFLIIMKTYQEVFFENGNSEVAA